MSSTRPSLQTPVQSPDRHSLTRISVFVRIAKVSLTTHCHSLTPAVALKTKRCLGLFSCGALGFVSRGDKTKRVWFWGGQNKTKPDRLVLEAPMVSKKQTKRAFGFAAQPL